MKAIKIDRRFPIRNPVHNQKSKVEKKSEREGGRRREGEEKRATKKKEKSRKNNILGRIWPIGKIQIK